MDYKNTLLLPKTDFPMRAELPKREPAFLAKWREEKIYDRIMEARKEAAKDPATTFVLHDGPPFANGGAHMGHALNMVLKDIVLKYHNMSGRYAPFVPGWDCHGLPIEHKVMKELGAAEIDPLKIREKCEATARHFVNVQREQFQRLGVFGDWDHAYLTLDPAYEAATLRVFATLVGKNLVYQGLRPVLWSTGCQTALAEAEIEYKEKVDPAIYVKFPISVSGRQLPEIQERTSLLIWTTTPWTLPANLAVAVSPQLDYAVYEIEGERLIFCTTLLGKIPKTENAKLIGEPFKGIALEGHVIYDSPLGAAERDAGRYKIYAADFVTADTGTGLVHIAPGHGYDDYQLGQQHGLPILAPIDDRGCFTAECGVPELVGQYVFKANAPIIELLKSKNLLFAQEEYRHDYPHCWRSKTPIVFRAVKQWFIKVDAFRADALAAIDGVKWIPESGRNRIRGAVESRPDWCISRQRAWGIPLPVFYGEGEQPLLSEKAVRKFADLVEKEGSGIWFARTADELASALDLPLGLKKGRDTLDVWIDSGTSWAAISKKRLDQRFPADLYLEGSDQHRGWFQSSLLTSVAATGQAPYKAVLTNGFVIDIEGKKLSKSGTGYQKPVDLMTLVNEHGADVLRLWVASQDYQDDIPFSHDIFARVADAYRSIRNTLRILLGNLSDFTPNDMVPQDQWTDLDKFFYQRYVDLGQAIEAAYSTYQFSQVYHMLNRFCAVDLSAQYVDVLKDRLYCNGKTDVSRRASQTVLTHILIGLTKYLAPLIPFTAEELWQCWFKTNSVHAQKFQLIDSTSALSSRNLPSTSSAESQWAPLFRLRDSVNEKLEEARREKKIGKSIEACVEITTFRPPLGTAAATTEATLEELFIISKVVIKPTDGKETITVTRAEDHGMKKCVRCWKYYDHLGSDPHHPKLCERCTKVVVDLRW